MAKLPMASAFRAWVSIDMRPNGRNIPLARPDIGALEFDLVSQVLGSDVLAMGPFTHRFEAGIASRAGRREGIACSSGTAGPHMGVRVLGIGEGDEVITYFAPLHTLGDGEVARTVPEGCAVVRLEVHVADALTKAVEGRDR